MLSRLLSKFGIVMMQLLGRLPLAWVRALGCFLGWALYVLAVPRRRVARANLCLCFPDLPARQIRSLTIRTFVHFAQAWLDRGWLWHGRPETVRTRLKLTGAVDELQGRGPTIIFAPHFYGLDAGGTALNQQLGRPMVSIYTPQRNPVVDAWLHDGRRRFGQLRLFYRDEGVKPIITALRAGELLYLLPDMNFGPKESVFVPFYGVSAATIPSLSRFARLGRAKVVPVISRMTAGGYDIEVHPAWADYPSDDVQADTAFMNHWLAQVIDTMPAQYYWVHKRFKTRPPGEPGVY